MRTLFCLILSAWSVAAATTNSITQHGITWYFDDAVTYGTFANGDYWVVGPVTITNINPACVTTNGITVNGAQVDPLGHATQTSAMSAQGYDSRMYQGNLGTNYSESLNVANDLPLTLDGPNSLISVISRPAQSAYSQLDTAAVLTVLTNAITDGGAYFRPPYCGVGFKPLLATNDINWSLLRTLAVVTNTPTFNSVETNFIRVWLEQNTGSANQSMHPLNNQLNYSAYNARNTQAGLLLLHLNYTIAQKKDLCIRLIQLGIDNYGVAKSGGVFIDLEGLNTGCKAPVVFAATMLNDADMKGWANGTTNLIFSDDRQLWYVTASDTNRSLSSKNGQAPEQYLASDIGTAEWGGQHLNYPQFDGRQWDRIYRSIAGVSLVGAALAMQLTEGAETVWNYPAFFDYYDRFYEVEESYDFTYDSSHVISLFIRGMWDNYRALGDLYTPTIATNNASGARVMGFRGLGMSVLPPPVSPYLLEQDFEGTGYDNAQTWSEQGSATLNEDYTSTVLVGSQSMLIDLTSNIGDIASPVITMPPGGGDIWYVYFQLRVLAFPSSGFRVATVTNSFDLSINASSNLVIRPQVGTGVATVGQLEAGVTYHVWMQGSGDDVETANAGTARVGFSTTGIRPNSGDNYAIDTDAAANGPYSAVQLILGSRQIGANYSVIIDKVRVGNELIGDNPQ